MGRKEGRKEQEGAEERVRQSHHSVGLGPPNLGKARQGKARADICTPLPLPLIFREKKKWERKTDRRREDNERPAAPADRPPKLD